MMVVIVKVIALKMKPNSVKIMLIDSVLSLRELYAYLLNNFDVYSRSYQELKR
jgi:hypothetical protein